MRTAEEMRGAARRPASDVMKTIEEKAVEAAGRGMRGTDVFVRDRDCNGETAMEVEGELSRLGYSCVRRHFEVYGAVPGLAGGYTVFMISWGEDDA